MFELDAQKLMEILNSLPDVDTGADAGTGAESVSPKTQSFTPDSRFDSKSEKEVEKYEDSAETPSEVSNSQVPKPESSGKSDLGGNTSSFENENATFTPAAEPYHSLALERLRSLAPGRSLWGKEEYEDAVRYVKAELSQKNRQPERSSSTTRRGTFSLDTDEVMQRVLEMDNFNNEVNSKTGGTKSYEEYTLSPEMQQAYQRAYQQAHSQKQSWEDVPSAPNTGEFCGNSFQYQSYTQDKTFNNRFNRGVSDEDSARSYIDICQELTSDVENMFKGFENITDLAVVSDILIFNGVAYQPVLPRDYLEYLPYDIRNEVSSGCFAWLFDFSVLRKMKSLTRLKFDSSDFVYSKVRTDLHIVFDFAPAHIFKACPALQVLQIGNTVITAQDFRSHDNLFHRQKRSEEIYNACVDKGWSATKYCWNSVKNVYRDPNRGALGKIWGITWRGVGVTVTGGATLAGKLGGLAVKAGKGIVNFANIVKNNR